MKAVYFTRHGGLEVYQYGDVPEPAPGPGEVLLQIRAAALNFNDIWARRGLPRVQIPLPHVSGTDAAGIVAEVGPGVANVKVGDEVITYPVNACRQCDACLAGEEVFCKQMKIWGFQTGPLDGSYAQFAKVQSAQVWRKPKHLTWAQAAAMTTSLLSVWRMLVTRARTKPCDKVLIWGASGGTGSLAILVTKLLGASPIAVTSSRDKAQHCESLGADSVILWKAANHDITNESGDHVVREVRRMTGGRGVDIVFDHVGETTWPISIECLRWGGSLVICGATEGYMPKIDLRYLWNKQLTFLGSHIGTHREWMEVTRLVEERRITPPVSRIYSLEDLAEAQHMMESRRIVGKIAVEIS